MDQHPLNNRYWSTAFVQGDHAGRHSVHSSDVDGQVDLHGHETVSSLIHVASIAEEGGVITGQLETMLEA